MSHYVRQRSFDKAVYTTAWIIETHMGVHPFTDTLCIALGGDVITPISMSSVGSASDGCVVVMCRGC